MYDTFSFVFTRIVNNLQLVFIDEGQKLWKKTATISKKNFRRRDSNWFHVKILFLFFERFQQQNHFAKKFKQQQCYLLKKTLDFMVFSWNWSKHVGYGLGIQWEHNLKKKKMNLFNKPTIQLMWTNYVYTLSRMWTRIDNYKKSSDLCIYFTIFFRDIAMNDFT